MAIICNFFIFDRFKLDIGLRDKFNDFFQKSKNKEKAADLSRSAAQKFNSGDKELVGVEVYAFESDSLEAFGCLFEELSDGEFAVLDEFLFHEA